jgi:hypothetical protein
VKANSITDRHFFKFLISARCCGRDYSLGATRNLATPLLTYSQTNVLYKLCPCVYNNYYWSLCLQCRIVTDGMHLYDNSGGLGV